MGDVFPDAVQFVVVPDDMFVIIALPKSRTGCIAHFVDLFGHCGFKRSDHGR